MSLAELSVTAVDASPPRLEVAGDLDLNTAPQLGVGIRSHAWAGPVVLDLRGVSFMDSRGMLSLLEAQRMVRSRGGELVLGEVSPPVRKVLELTQAWDLFAHEGGTVDRTS
jgi:stage II sporulation protein AA (anti-sigma F factor antagonist)